MYPKIFIWTRCFSCVHRIRQLALSEVFIWRNLYHHFINSSSCFLFWRGSQNMKKKVTAKKKSLAKMKRGDSEKSCDRGKTKIWAVGCSQLDFVIYHWFHYFPPFIMLFKLKCIVPLFTLTENCLSQGFFWLPLWIKKQLEKLVKWLSRFL